MNADEKIEEKRPEEAGQATKEKPQGQEETIKQVTEQPPPLPPRDAKTVTNARGSTTAPASALTQAKDMLAQATTSAKRYSSFWLEHVKKGEMPWTQWYCCGLVGGKECETENHRLHKECKKCGHRVCENCPKSKL